MGLFIENFITIQDTGHRPLIFIPIHLKLQLLTLLYIYNYVYTKGDHSTLVDFIIFMYVHV